MTEENKSRWYQNGFVIVLLIIFFFPIGLFLMWRQPNWNKKIKWGIIGFFGLMFLLAAIGGSTAPKTTSISDNQIVTTTAQPSSTPKPTEPQKVNNVSAPTIKALPTSKPVPTDTPIPTPTTQQLDTNGFPTDYQKVTVTNIAKVPSAYNKVTVMFTCKILSFAKDDNGDASAFNCSDPSNIGAIIQVVGPLYDFTQINENDTVRVYGGGQGASTGKNIYGGDVSEAIILGVHINDLTSGYKE